MNFAPPPRAYGEISFGARLAGIFGDLFFKDADQPPKFPSKKI
jgi:hypothetical protein